MAFVFDNTIIDTIKTNSDVGLGIKLASESSLFTTLYDINEQAKENLKTLLLTSVGERYMIPQYGSKLLNIIFQPNIDTLKIQIDDIIRTAVNTWLPYISIEQLDITTASDDPTLNNSTEIKLTFNVQEFQTQSITIGIADNKIIVS